MPTNGEGETLEFGEYLVAQGLSPKTIRVYLLRYNQARLWCVEHSVALYTASPIQIADLAATFPHTSSTKGQLRTALAYYWEMTGRPNPPVKAIRVPPAPKGYCRAVSPEVARDLVKVSLGWRPEGTAVLFGLYLALRNTEIGAAQWSRFDEGMEWYTVTGKFDITATIPVHPVLRAELATIRHAGDYIFPGRGSRIHVTQQTIWNWVQRVAREVGLSHLRPHDLRHTALATTNDATGDLRATSEFARHSSVRPTQRYTRTTRSRLVETVAALDYLA